MNHPTYLDNSHIVSKKFSNFLAIKFQVLGADTEPKKKLKHIVMAATRWVFLFIISINIQDKREDKNDMQKNINWDS